MLFIIDTLQLCMEYKVGQIVASVHDLITYFLAYLNTYSSNVTKFDLTRKYFSQNIHCNMLELKSQINLKLPIAAAKSSKFYGSRDRHWLQQQFPHYFGQNKARLYLQSKSLPHNQL